MPPLRAVIGAIPVVSIGDLRIAHYSTRTARLRVPATLLVKAPGTMNGGDHDRLSPSQDQRDFGQLKTDRHPFRALPHHDPAVSKACQHGDKQNDPEHRSPQRVSERTLVRTDA